MLSEDLLIRCQAVRRAYRELEIKHHGKEWSIEEDLLALTNDRQYEPLGHDAARTLL